MFTIAVEIPFELASTVGMLFAGCLYGAGKFWWELRDLKKGSKGPTKRDLADAKDAHIKTLEGQIAELKKAVSYRELLDAKDVQIEGLSKALSKKSDEVAAKVQELLTLTLEKAEDAADKNGALVERTLERIAAFTEEVRVLSATLASLSARR